MSSKKRKESYIGKTIIIGLTYLNENEQVEQRKQLFGVISKIDEELIFVELEDGTSYTLPPDLQAVKIAPPGEYEFETTGRVIINPDYMTSWKLYKPKKHNNT